MIKKDILVLDEGPTQRLDDITITGEAKHFINFTRPKEKLLFKYALKWKQQFFIC